MTQKWLLLLFLLLFVFVAGLYTGRYKLTPAYADVNSSIPRSFGSCRGALGSELLIFEDGNGTVRLVHPASGSVFGTVVRK
jgi:hypothetical protein